MAAGRLAALLTILGAGCLPSGPGTVAATSTAIVAGDPDEGDPAVVGLSLFGSLGCSGVRVDGDAVITAAHCVEGFPLEALAVVLGSAAPPEGTAVPVLAVAVHPGFDRATREHDVAALILDGEALGPEPAPAPPLFLGPFEDALLGAPVRVVGFGTSSAEDRSAGGHKRSGLAVLAGYDDLAFDLAPDPATPCYGDSGGPALIQDEGVEQVAGLVSEGTIACDGLARAVRVDAYAARFLAPAIAQMREGRPLAGGCSAGGRSRGGGAAVGCLLVLLAALAQRLRLRGRGIR